MKTSLKLIALVLAAGYPCLAIAEVLGAKLPAVLNFENVATLFSLSLIGLTLVGDYSRRPSSLASRSAIAPTEPNHETHRLAA
jgi:hypothetical protein